jgi:hypothetical protein
MWTRWRSQLVLVLRSPSLGQVRPERPDKARGKRPSKQPRAVDQKDEDEDGEVAEKEDEDEAGQLSRCVN